MSTPPRTLAIAALVIGITACSSHTTATGPAGPVSTPTRQAAAHPKISTQTSATSGKPATATAAPGARPCPTRDTSARIGGASRCLAAGQQCSAKHAADYPAYGFTCDQKGQRYILTKK